MHIFIICVRSASAFYFKVKKCVKKLNKTCKKRTPVL